MERRERGFTLGELLTTVGVAAVAMAIAVPALNQGLIEQRRTTAMNELVATLHLARSTAITRNQPVTVCASPDQERCSGNEWASGWIAFVDPEFDREHTGDLPLLIAAPGDSELKIRSAEFSQYLGYRPTGQVMTDAQSTAVGAFTICPDADPDAGRLLVIRASGKPALRDRQADGQAPDCPAS